MLYMLVYIVYTIVASIYSIHGGCYIQGRFIIGFTIIYNRLYSNRYIIIRAVCITRRYIFIHGFAPYMSMCVYIDEYYYLLLFLKFKQSECSKYYGWYTYIPYIPYTPLPYIG